MISCQTEKHCFDSTSGRATAELSSRLQEGSALSSPTTFSGFLSCRFPSLAASLGYACQFSSFQSFPMTPFCRFSWKPQRHRRFKWWKSQLQWDELSFVSPVYAFTHIYAPSEHKTKIKFLSVPFEFVNKMSLVEHFIRRERPICRHWISF